MQKKERKKGYGIEMDKIWNIRRAFAFQRHCDELHNADFEVCADPQCRAIVEEEVRRGELDGKDIWPSYEADTIWPQNPTEWAAMWKWTAKQYRRITYELLECAFDDMEEMLRLRERLCDTYETLTAIHSLVMGDEYATNKELIEAIQNLTQRKGCECAKSGCGGCREAK